MAKETTINVSPQDLIKASDEVRTWANSYKKEYEALFGDIELLNNSWDGQDWSGYKARTDKFRNDFETMYDNMMSYSTYLLDTGKAYQKTQDNIANSVSSLSIGN